MAELSIGANRSVRPSLSSLRVASHTLARLKIRRARRTVVEHVFDLLVQSRIEQSLYLGSGEEVLCGTESPPSRSVIGKRVECVESRNRLACLCDDDLLSLGSPLHELRKVGLRFVDVYSGGHETSLTYSLASSTSPATLRACSNRKFRVFSVRMWLTIWPIPPLFSSLRRTAATGSRSWRAMA